MEHDELIARVHELRAQGLPPKAVARSLGMTGAQVKPLIREAAAANEGEPGERPIVTCSISPGWDDGLSWEGHPEWADNVGSPHPGGLACVLLAREQRWGRVTVCGFLVDVYCLGVKNALGPKVMREQELPEYADEFFTPYESGPIDVPLELAQHLVFGAVDYARSLGFEPHPDFKDAAAHLGQWTGPSAITFGKDGTPLYISGPNDNPRQVMATLGKSAGEGNFQYSVEVGHA